MNVELRVSPYWLVDLRRLIKLCPDQKRHHARQAAHRAKRARECRKVSPAMPWYEQ